MCLLKYILQLLCVSINAINFNKCIHRAYQYPIAAQHVILYNNNLWMLCYKPVDSTNKINQY